MAIISITGRIGNGKDLTGKIIQYLVDHKAAGYTHPISEKDFNDYIKNGHDKTSRWEVKKWASKLKQIASMLTGIPVEKFEDQEFKKTFLPDCWGYWTVYSWYEHRHDTEKKFEVRPEIGRYSTKEEAEKALPEVKYNMLPMYLNYDPVSGVAFRKMTVRQFLQDLGTNAMRYGLHPNVWVNSLMSEYKPFQKCEVWEDAHPDEPGPYWHFACRDCHQSYMGYKLQPYCKDCAKIDRYPNWIITDTRFENELAAVKGKVGVSIRVNRGDQSNTEGLHESETALDKATFDYVIDNNGTVEELIFKVKDILEKENII